MDDVIKTFSLLGTGTIFGILIKYFLDLRSKKIEILFTARQKAYSDLMGKLLNHFHELSKLSNEGEKVGKMNEIFSEVYLLGGKKLIKNIQPYKEAILKLHKRAVENFKDGKDTRIDEVADQYLKDCSKLADKIHKELRKDLFL